MSATAQDWSKLFSASSVKLLGMIAFTAVLIGGAGIYEARVSERLAKLHLLEAYNIDLLKSLLDCETGVRGYLIARDERFLEPLSNCSASVRDHLGAFSGQADLETAVSAVLDDIKNTLQSISVGKSALEQDALLRSKRLMDTARHSIASVGVELQKSTAKARRDLGILHALQVAGFIIILIYVSWLLRKSVKASEELVQRLRLERAIWDNSADALFLYELSSGTIIDVNEAAARLVGLKPADIIGRHFTEFAPSFHHESTRSRVDQVGAQPQSSVPGELMTASGQSVPVEVAMSSAIILDSKELCVSSFRSLNARYEAFQETAFRKAIESAVPSGLAAISDDGEQMYVNGKLCEMLGWSEKELIGQTPPFPYWPPEETGNITSIFKDALAGRLASSGTEIKFMRRSGERFPAQIFVSRIEGGRRPGWMAFVIDITEKKKIEAAVEEMRRLEAIGQLAGQVAHDFNNLLAIILLNTRLAQQSGSDKEELAACINTIGEAAKRGASITKTMLAVARQQPLKPERVELGQQLAEISSLLEAAAGPAVGLEIDVAAAPIWVEVDRGGLTASLLNLAVNARDAMPEGGILRLRLSKGLSSAAANGGRKETSTGIIEVIDTGVGMTASVKTRAFEPFFSTKSEAGTGLGLAMVYGFVKQSGGDAEIESEPNSGTTIRLFIPMCLPGPDVNLLPEDSLVEHKYRILVVDDEPALLQALGTTLTSMGHEVSLAADAVRSLELLEQQRFDLLLTDILMPGMGGIELAEVAARHYPELSVVLMTGYGMRPAHANPPWPVLEKPFGPEELSTLFKEKNVDS